MTASMCLWVGTSGGGGRLLHDRAVDGAGAGAGEGNDERQPLPGQRGGGASARCVASGGSTQPQRM
jgi:hypothetical protein